MWWPLKYWSVLLLPPIYMVCDRLYPWAPDYLWAHIVDAVGEGVNSAATLGVMVCIIPRSKPGLRIVVTALFVWRLVALLLYVYIQFTGDHSVKSIAWVYGFRGSGLTYIAGKFGFIQEVFVISVIAYIFYKLWTKSKELKMGAHDGF